MSDLTTKPSKFWILMIGFFLAVWLTLAAFPFLWTVWGSFKVEGDFFSKANWNYAISGGAYLGRGLAGVSPPMPMSGRGWRRNSGAPR